METKTFITAIFTALCLAPCFAQKHQHGKASFYSKRATGARSASGQRIHHDSLVCAHRFYPFGTHLKVTNLSNGKSVVVKVIDRGPFGRGRIIDISWAAAKAIGMIAQGVATVKVEMVENPIPFKPESKKLPIIDFEMAEADYKFPSKWGEKKEEKAPIIKKEGTETTKHENKKTTEQKRERVESAKTHSPEQHPRSK